MPLEDTLFRLFPIEVQKGQELEVCVVLFTQGINEQQSLADRIGDNTLQDTINMENCRAIRQYIARFGEVFALAGGVWREGQRGVAGGARSVVGGAIGVVGGTRWVWHAHTQAGPCYCAVVCADTKVRERVAQAEALSERLQAHVTSRKHKNTEIFATMQQVRTYLVLCNSPAYWAIAWATDKTGTDWHIRVMGDEA